jgi:hypothetical protein
MKWNEEEEEASRAPKIARVRSARFSPSLKTADVEKEVKRSVAVITAGASGIPAPSPLPRSHSYGRGEDGRRVMTACVASRAVQGYLSLFQHGELGGNGGGVVRRRDLSRAHKH